MVGWSLHITSWNEDARTGHRTAERIDATLLAMRRDTLVVVVVFYQSRVEHLAVFVLPSLMPGLVRKAVLCLVYIKIK